MKKFAFLCALMPTVAVADADPKMCHSIAEDTGRLACYDRVTTFSEAVTVTAPAKPGPEGKQWNVQIEGSALDDRKDVYLRVMSDKPEGTGYGNTSHAFFYVRCMKNSTNSFITFNSYTTDDQSVKYRVDDGPMQKVWMETMNGGDGIGIWSGTRAIPFIKGLLDKEKLVVAYESYSNANLEFTFDISGLRNQIGPLAESCGWKM